jgi:hypothetical protein
MGIVSSLHEAGNETCAEVSFRAVAGVNSEHRRMTAV